MHGVAGPLWCPELELPRPSHLHVLLAHVSTAALLTAVVSYCELLCSACHFVLDLALYCHRLPFYYIAKLGFLVALWHPSTKLALTIYAKVFSPLLASYEADIDRFVVEARTKLSDLAGHQAGQ